MVRITDPLSTHAASISLIQIRRKLWNTIMTQEAQCCMWFIKSLCPCITSHVLTLFLGIIRSRLTHTWPEHELVYFIISWSYKPQCTTVGLLIPIELMSAAPWCLKLRSARIRFCGISVNCIWINKHWFFENEWSPFPSLLIRCSYCRALAFAPCPPFICHWTSAISCRLKCRTSGETLTRLWGVTVPQSR